MIVIARNYGRLGNRLWLYAYLIAAAREYGVTLVNPSFAEYARYFSSTAHDLWCRYPTQPTSNRPPETWQRKILYHTFYLSTRTMCHLRLTRFPARILRLKRGASCDLGSVEFADIARGRQPLLISGWQFRSERLLERHAVAVRKHFEIIPEHRQRVDRLINAVRQQADKVVGVHIRHGDYATWLNGKYFYSIPKYRAAMQQIAKQHGNRNLTFLVCGNTDLKREDFGDLNVHFGTGHLIEDMYAFAETDLLIGPPSTYTEWASFYGQAPLQLIEAGEQTFDLSAMQSRTERTAAPSATRVGCAAEVCM